MLYSFDRSRSSVVRFRHRAACMAIAAGLCAGIASAQSGPLRAVALTGTDGPLGPGLGAGVEFDTFGPGGVSIASSGAVTFQAGLFGAGVDASNSLGLWAWRGGDGPSLVARIGDPVPTLGDGFVYESFNAPPQVVGTNSVTFQAQVAGPGVDGMNNDCLFTERPGWPTAIMREGVTIAPGSVPSVPFGSSLGNVDPWVGNRWVTNDAGQTAFRVQILTPDPGVGPFGIFVERDEGVLEKFFIRDEAWTDGPPGTTFGGSGAPLINSSGAVAAMLLVRGDPVITSGMFSDRATDGNGFGMPGLGDLAPMALVGELAPGTGIEWGSMVSTFVYDFNSNGRVAFRGEFAPPGPGQGGGLWSDARFGVNQLVALSGANAPGADGASFNLNSLFVNHTVLSENNCVALDGHLLIAGPTGGGNNRGIWTTRSPSTGGPGNPRLLMREGSPVPATDPEYIGLAFGEPDGLWISGDGRTMVSCLLNDFSRSIWFEQADGTLAPLVKEFAPFDLFGDGSDVRFVTELHTLDRVSGTGDGRVCAVNNSNDAAFRLVFVDGSEAIITSAPQPACDAPAFTADPVGGLEQPGSMYTFTTDTAGSGPIRVRWRKDGVDIPGAVGDTLTLDALDFDDAGVYTAVAENACGEVVSAGAELLVAAACPADIDLSGEVDLNDYFAFLGLFFAQLDPVNPQPGSADIDGSGLVDLNDYFEFLGVFFNTFGPCV